MFHPTPVLLLKKPQNSNVQTYPEGNHVQDTVFSEDKAMILVGHHAMVIQLWKPYFQNPSWGDTGVTADIPGKDLENSVDYSMGCMCVYSWVI